MDEKASIEMEWRKYEGDIDPILTTIWMVRDMLKQVDSERIASFFDSVGRHDIATRARHGLEYLSIAELTSSSIVTECVMPVIFFAGPDSGGDFHELAALAVESGLTAQAERGAGE